MKKGHMYSSPSLNIESRNIISATWIFHYHAKWKTLQSILTYYFYSVFRTTYKYAFLLYGYAMA